VDSVLPSGLAEASDDEVRAAVTQVLAPGSPAVGLRYTLSEQAESSVDGWTSPAFTAQLVYDSAAFDSYSEEELWLREVQSDLRADAVYLESLGVTIDGNVTLGEATGRSAPFIFLAVALIILLVAIVHRSYWSAVVVGSGLAATSLAYYGTSALLGLKMGSMLLTFIVPIAMISFGVDFYIHGVGRVREMQVERGFGVAKAYPFGMTAVFTALLLAVSSSIAAFMANAASGTEAIIQFGIGSSVSLVWAYLLLGQIGPRVTVGIEQFVGDDPVKGTSKVPYAVGTLLTAILGGLSVALSAVMPSLGAVALIVFVGVSIAIPAFATRRRNRRAASRGTTLVHGHSGAAHGLASVGTTVRFLARWRFVTIPVVAVIAIFGFVRASGVTSGFEFKDFLSTDTDFVQSLERVTAHFPSSGQGSSLIFVEGDLTDPINLAAIDDAVDELAASTAEFGRDPEGDLLVRLHAADLVRMTLESPAVSDLEAAGLDLTDSDGDGIPDAKATIAAIYRNISNSGVLTADGAMAIPSEELPAMFVDRGSDQATAIVVQVGSYTDGEIIIPVEGALDAAAAQIETTTDDVSARVTGDVLAQYHGMDAFTRSMLVSLPLALLLALLIAWAMLRSARYALVSVLPIGLVVVGIYAFMATFGYAVNVVTATIAAIAVGVGIDFSTHFTARFREEMGTLGTPLDAVARAGAGTGGALVLSATTSVLGFSVMALAPTPIFATFGVLTAVMIVLSLMVSLLVLPSLLVLVSPKGSTDPNVDPVVERESVLV
jgi:predicted RND superfamily exporter protein